MTVSEEFDHTQRGRQSLGHRAATQVALRLIDPGLIGQLVSRAEPEHPQLGRAMAAAGGFDSVSIDPGEHEVFASIEATFALETEDRSRPV